jgi:hypothetical protein
MWFITWISCTQTGVETTTAVQDPPVEDPSAWSYQGDADPTPILDLEDVAIAIEELISKVLATNASPVLQGYDSVMVHSDDYCPYAYAYEDLSGPGLETTLWYGGCQTQDGTEYGGYAFHVVYDDYYEAASDVTYNGVYIAGQAEVIETDGSTFRAGGVAYAVSGIVSEGTDAEFHLNYSILSGTFSWDGDEGRSWLSTDLLPDLTLMSYWWPSYDSGYLYLHGGASGLGGTVDTVVFDELQIADAAIGWCDKEPYGQASVRDDDGNWYDVIYDGETWDAPALGDGTCDGCGAVYFRGDYLGEACSDFSPLISWELRPW